MRMSEHFSRSVKRGIYIAGSLMVLFLAAYLLIPATVDFFWGEQIIERHVADVLGAAETADEAAFKILSWEDLNFEDPYSTWEGKWYNKYSIYHMNGSYKWFIRSNQLSWLITSKLGNCGERAYYFVQMMEEAGYPARVVCVVEDHCWAEYQSGGFWIAVDPSQAEYVTPENYVLGRNWSRIEARYLNGSMEDVTYRYLNTAELFITSEKMGGQVNIYSTVLSSSGSPRYASPSLVTTRKLEEPFTLRLGYVPTYQLVYKRDYGPISFHKRFSDIKLPTNISLVQGELINLKNLRFNTLWIVWFSLFSIFLFAVIRRIMAEKRK